MGSRISKGFDLLAPVYTQLASLFFGKSLKQAQIHFLSEITPSDLVLILGGGSGNFLQALLKKHPQLNVDYIDISPNMIRLARQKTGSPSNVRFIEGTEQNIPKKNYSVVITHFYLDLFTDKRLTEIINLIRQSLQHSARWVVTDFVNEKFWHKIMLWMMYRFFRITTGIKARHLPNWTQQLSSMQEIGSKKFFGDFIKTAVYKNT